MVLLFVFSLVTIFFIFLAKNINLSVFDNVRTSLVKAFLSIFFLTVFITELLSFFKILNYKNVSFGWSIFLFIFILFLLSNIKTLRLFFNKLRSKKVFIKKSYFLVILFLILFVLIPLLFIAYYYPPNTGDSLGYHLPRVEHWIKNQNVDHYPTSDIRQLFHQPLSEFLILNLNLLSKSDQWANFIQFFSMICSIFLITLMIKLFGLNYKYQILSAVLSFTVSMGLLQASSTQTDYLASFLLLASIYFLFIFFKNRKFNNVVFSALALSLGAFTKLTVLVFAFPFFVWFLILILSKYRKYFFKIAGVFLLALILVNGLFYFRNYKFTGNILGDSAISKMMRNRKMGLNYFISSVIRNISLHMAFPLGNSLFNKVVDKLHTDILGVSSFDENTTLSCTGYEPFFAINEDLSGNFFLIFIIFFIFTYILFNFRAVFPLKNGLIFFYLIALVTGFLIYCLLFKWQPWGARLHLPVFVLSIPIVTFFISKFDFVFRKYFLILSLSLSSFLLLSFLFKNRSIFFVLIFLTILFFLFIKYLNVKNSYIYSIVLSSFIFSIPYVYFHRVRPLIGNNELFFSSREAKYFRYNFDSYLVHKDMIAFLKDYDVNNVILKFNGCFNEYLFWVLLKREFREFNLEHAFSGDKYVKNDNFDKNISFMGLISNIDNYYDYIDKSNICEHRRFYLGSDFLDIVILKKAMVI